VKPPPEVTLTISVVGQSEAGKGGEGGVPHVTNKEFVAAVFQILPDGATAAVCTKAGSPDVSFPVKWTTEK